MAIKEIPTNFRVYYTAMRKATKPKYEEGVEKYENLLKEEKALYEEVVKFKKQYLDIYKFNFDDYSEIVDNEYKDGTFYDHAKGLFLNKKDNYKATSSLYRLYKLARLQKDVYKLKKQIHTWEVMLDLSLNQYRDVLENYYNEVVKKLIIDGYGYVFENPIGWICINRCKVIQGARRKLNYKATKENKAKLLAEGKRLWNKDEAEYAAKVGLDYDGVDYRVYIDEEYCYEFPLINCRVNKGEKLRLEINTSHRGIAGKTEEEILKECNYDKAKICELKLNPRNKLYLCLKVDKLLYLNFIRNEGQQTYHTTKAGRKNRQ